MRSDRSCCRRCSLHSLWIGSLWEGTDLAEGCTSGSARTRWHAVCIAVTQTMVCSTGPPTKNTSSLTSPSGWVQTLAAVLRSRASCQRYFVQTDILDGRPDNGQTTWFRREDVNLIGALSHIAKQTFKGIGGPNVSVHALRKLVKRERFFFLL